MNDTITLPREVVQEALEALELEATSPPLETTAASMAALRTHLAAPKQEPVRCNPADYCAARHMNLYTAPTHPGYVIGSHWLETAYSRICAGEAEADVLRDCGWRRCAVGQGLTQHCAEAEALRRENERLREALPYDWDQLEACRESLREHMAKIKRLREALEKIADASMSMHQNAAHMAMSLQRIAEAALRREEAT